MLTAKCISFIGGGAICEALLKGILDKKMLTPEQISVSDVNPERTRLLSEEFGVGVSTAVAAAEFADILFLTVKPHIVAPVLQEIGRQIAESVLIVSVAAGVKISTIEALLPGRRVIRVMPNTPVAVGAGMSAITKGKYATESDVELVNCLFSAVGRAVVVDEPMMDAVTGMSGSGPGYVFVLIDALTDAGVRVGLARDTALLLAAQTFLGAAKMVLETGKHPSALRDMVTSPGGSTIAGIQVLEDNAVRSALIKAVVAATERSREMGRDK